MKRLPDEITPRFLLSVSMRATTNNVKTCKTGTSLSEVDGMIPSLKEENQIAQSV